MGRGSYTAADWQKLRNSRSIFDGSTAESLFKNQQMNEKFDPKFIGFRESFDSEDSPQSTPIILGFDVTGSMGYLAEEIAKNSLNETITQVLEKQPVTNPHVLVAAIGDSKSDYAPLQVTQFEADIRIVEQLLDLYLEGHGGGNGGESYNLAWYFAAKHTKTDCNEKRKKKGFLFTIGDEPCHLDLTSQEIKRVFDDKTSGFLSTKLFEEASKKYEIFHIVLFNQSNPEQQVFSNWNKIIGKRYATLATYNVNCISKVITTIMQIVSGVPMEDAIDQWDPEDKDTIAKAISTIDFDAVLGKKKSRLLF